MLHSITGGQHPRMPSTPIIGTAKNTPEDLTDVIAATRRMTSILATLLDERIVDTCKGEALTVYRQDAADIQFAARQVVDLVDRVGEIWEALP